MCLHSLPGVSDPCQPSSHLTLPVNESRVSAPTVTSLHSQPHVYQTCSDAATGCPSADDWLFLESRTEELQASGTGGGVHSVVEAKATCAAYSIDPWKQLPYCQDICVLGFEVHRMRPKKYTH